MRFHLAALVSRVLGLAGIVVEVRHAVRFPNGLVVLDGLPDHVELRTWSVEPEDPAVTMRRPEGAQ